MRSAAMLSANMILGVLLTTSAAAASAASSGPGATAESPFSPDIEAARANGPHVFNAIHNAMREFGSALHHNGMSLFPAVVPAGVLLYHGTDTGEVPASFDWLAFEIEHAEMFSHIVPQPSAGSDAYQTPHRGIQQLLQGRQPQSRPDAGNISGQEIGAGTSTWPGHETKGYLHIYRTTEPLNLLYIDGMAAGKTSIGTTDTQDLLLTKGRERTPWDDFRRAVDLCDLAVQWRVDGFIRMEPGFEVILCSFDHGVELLSRRQRPRPRDKGHYIDWDEMVFWWVHAAAERYSGLGIGADRVEIDYSSMVSAYLFPVNLTNPDHRRPELPRLLQATDEQLAGMRAHTRFATARSRAKHGEIVDWRGVTDMIVSRYANRLQFLSQAATLVEVRMLVSGLVNLYIDYSGDDDDDDDDDDDIVEHASDQDHDEYIAVRQRCARHYLLSVNPGTEEDFMIDAAIETTMYEICNVLFQVRELVLDIDEEEQEDIALLQDVKTMTSDLMETLGWAEWKACGPCGKNEVCLVAMWPLGDVEDHYQPGCRNRTGMSGRHSYWNRDW